MMASSKLQTHRLSFNITRINKLQNVTIRLCSEEHTSLRARTDDNSNTRRARPQYLRNTQPQKQNHRNMFKLSFDNKLQNKTAMP